MAVTDLQTTFSPAELATFTRLLSEHDDYVEYGSGYSTVLAAQRGIRVRSVESDIEWINRLRSEPSIQAADREGRLALLHADIGRTKELGYPIDDSNKASWYRYPATPWENWSETGRTLVLVDGRFRVACTLMSIGKATARTTIAIHDFWDRPHYHSVLKYLDCIERADRMGVFRRRSDLNLDSLLDDFTQSQYAAH